MQHPPRYILALTLLLTLMSSSLQAFLGRYSVMLENGGRDPSTPAGIELQNTVLDRRQEEARAALFSDWASAAYAWNKEETAQGMSPPSNEFWTQVLVSCSIPENSSHEGLQSCACMKGITAQCPLGLHVSDRIYRVVQA